MAAHEASRLGAESDPEDAESLVSPMISQRNRCRPAVLGLIPVMVLSATACALTLQNLSKDYQKGPDGSLGAVELAELKEPELFQSTSKGFGTWYDPTKWGGGTCGYDYEWQPPGVAGTVALNFKDFNAGGKMESCGMCIKVFSKGDYGWNGKSGGGSLPMHWNGDIFFVTNACATCPDKGDIDFALKPGQGTNPGPAGNGKWDITWTGVPCPTEDGKGAHYMLDSGDNKYWVKARPLNLHYPVVRMEYQEGGKWKAGTVGKQFGFSWNPSAGAASSPLKVRLTSVTGEVLEDSLPELAKFAKGGHDIMDTSLAGDDNGDSGSESDSDSSPNSGGGDGHCSDLHNACKDTKCCKDAGAKCYQKNEHWMQCMHSCTPGYNKHDPPEHRTQWSCHVVS